MFKYQLMQLLNLHLIDRKSKKEVNELLQLTGEETNIILKNKGLAKPLYEVIKSLKGNTYYSFILDKISNIDDEEQLKIIVDLATDSDLLASEHYKLAINKALEIESIKLLEQFKLLAWNKDLLASDYYEFTLNSAMKISDDELLRCFLILAYSKNLLNSEHYKYVINKAAGIKRLKLLERLKSFAVQKQLLNSTHYEFIIEKALEIKDEKVLEQFKILVFDENLLNSKRHKFTLTKALEINDDKLLAQFKLFACNKMLLASDYYEDVINKLAKVNSSEAYTIFSNIYSDMTNRKVFDFSAFLKILDVKNIEILRKIELVLTSTKEEKKYRAMLDAISKALNIKNESAILEILNEVDEYRIQDKEELDVNEVISSRNIVTVISDRLTLKEIETILGDVEEDEDITPDTFVKTKS